MKDDKYCNARYSTPCVENYWSLICLNTSAISCLNIDDFIAQAAVSSFLSIFESTCPREFCKILLFDCE